MEVEVAGKSILEFRLWQDAGSQKIRGLHRGMKVKTWRRWRKNLGGDRKICCCLENKSRWDRIWNSGAIHLHRGIIFYCRHQLWGYFTLLLLLLLALARLMHSNRLDWCVSNTATNPISSTSPEHSFFYTFSLFCHAIYHPSNKVKWLVYNYVTNIF